MKVEVKYSSGQTYGPNRDSTKYVASVRKLSMDLEVVYEFTEKPARSSGVKKSDASIDSLSLVLSAAEATQLATTLLTQLHHPYEANKPVRWMLAGSMPKLGHDVRETIVVTKNSVSPSRSPLDRVKVENRSNAYIGRISLAIKSTVQPKGGTVFRDVYMAPGTEQVLEVSAKDLGCNGVLRIKSVEILDAWGICVEESLA